MAVAMQCDICGKYYEGSKENHFTYEEDGQEFLVNSFRLGNWNSKTKNWDSIVSAYDICKDCGKQITQAIFDVNGGDNRLKSRMKIKKIVPAAAAEVPEDDGK